MEQRRLRPGDSLEDYCPRERRLTDHVIVAVVDDAVKQTRCVACDTEHPFKDGKVPPRRKKKEAPAVLVQRDIEGATDEDMADNENQPEMQPNLVMRPERKPGKGKRAAAAVAPPPAIPAVVPPPPIVEPEPPPLAHSTAEPEDDGPVHRRLIRATLPRPEGQAPGRPLPEFTIRQPGSRGPFSRGGQGNRFGNKGPARFAGDWNGKMNGHGGHKSGAPVPGAGSPGHGRHKPGRSRQGRPQHKKTR